VYSGPRSVESEQLRKLSRRDPLKGAREVWEKSKLPQGLKVPDWYCMLYGTSPWHLTRASSHLSDRRNALAFIVRLNYLTDVIIHFGHEATVTRRLPVPEYFSDTLSAFRQKLTLCVSGSQRVCWGHSPFYNWRGALSCALRRYVDLAYPCFRTRLPVV
jgi:hypothetical protein